jgi:hypothetical protein
MNSGELPGVEPQKTQTRRRRVEIEFSDRLRAAEALADMQEGTTWRRDEVAKNRVSRVEMSIDLVLP